VEEDAPSASGRPNLLTSEGFAVEGVARAADQAVAEVEKQQRGWW